MRDTAAIIEQNGKERKKFKLIKANTHIYIMLIPVILYYLIFAYIPMYGISLAFKTYKPGGLYNLLFGGNWNNFEYFKTLFSDPLFFRAFRNTLIISGMNILIYFPLVIVFVLMLNELRSVKFKKAIQTITYMPHFFSWVIIAGIVRQLLTVNGGVVANMLSVFNNGMPVSLMTDPKAFRWVLLVSSTFKEMGWDTIIYLSALAGIPMELYEAAEVDGANRFKRMLHITIPGILPTICTVLLLKISFMVNGSFDQVYMMYNSSVYETGDIIETYLFRAGVTNGEFGYSTAMGLTKAMISGVLLISCNALSKKVADAGIY